MSNEEILDEKIEDEPATILKYIYIIRNYINDKVYIGQTNNPERRFREHLRAKDNHAMTSPIHRAIQKYGAENFYYEIVEDATPDFDEREKYWIKFFNSKVPNGYNVLEGGNGYNNKKTLNKKSKPFSQTEIEEIYKLLLNESLTIVDIAKYFNATFKVIDRINRGECYRQKDYDYPIRKFKKSKIIRLFGNEFIDNIIYDLQYNKNLSLKKIARKYNTHHDLISSINKGTCDMYRRDNIVYPIRDIKPLSTSEYIDDIRKDLKENVLSIQQIADKYNSSYCAIGNINAGRTYFDENEIYPLRKHALGYDYYDENICEKIRQMLKDDCDITTIVKELNLPNNNLVHDINNGKTHKSDKYTYPIKNIKDRFSKELIEKITNEIANTKKTLAQIAEENNINESSIWCIKNGFWDKYRLPNYTYPLRPNKNKKNEKR